ncbi:MAG: hypothetical protein M1510_10650 [Nitrospirae bacterium]|nr:hypothetical protein [Nitrospirota bacterium]MCL5237406.1 hypothetical protein [Nitrospirota bacterium]
MSEKKECTYEIGGKKYLQRPLVLGQAQQLLEVLEGISFNRGMNTMGIISALGNKISKAIAVVLIEDGVTLEAKDVDKMEQEIKFKLSLKTTIQVVEDFFGCNPVALLLQRLNGMAEKIAGNMEKTGSENSSASSQGATLPGGTESYGDTPTKSASPTSDTGSGS